MLVIDYIIHRKSQQKRGLEQSLSHKMAR